MSRSAMRFVVHSITHEPQGGLTAQTFCVTHGCGEDSGPRAEADQALDWALQHTGRTGHDLFRREYIDHARVTAHA